ncbi:MAG: ATP-binding protein [Bacteroidota bacterium]
MEQSALNIKELQDKIHELEIQLVESQSIIEAIQDGSVDALVLNKDGQHSIYALETADYTYRILIEKVQEGALSISENGLILYCNEYFAKLINVPDDKVVGTYFNSYIDSVGQFQELRNALKNGPSKGEIILNINGIKLQVYISLTDLKPFVPAIGIIVSDLSQKKQHEEDLAVYQRKLELKVNELNEINAHLVEFIHVISHDIKEPLRKIVAYSSHLRQLSSDKFEKDEIKMLSVVSNAATRLNSLVDDLVKYSITARKIELNEIDLNKILKEVTDDLDLSINEMNAQLLVNDLPKVNGSEVQMRQLFLNLLSNALKFKKADITPTIRISHEIRDCVDFNFPNKKFHRISIHDNGIGIEKQQLTKVFMIFQRLHMPEEYPGNGVGLAICKKIMENHLGRIDVESTPGDGSTFNVYFPI